ncbi:2-oxo acid dehydrogenase subunit E2, partial [Staphylococcus epidermidis]|uniref:2-oxo acid dehydrogenase subunit E2 n=1 Tax=Staphylococcus epidermidis TaxID=1282 RepID=UPI00164326A0
DQDLKLTLTTLLPKPLLLPLKQYPPINPPYQQPHLTHYQHLHLPIPTSLHQALILPLINHPDTKTTPTLPHQIKSSPHPLPQPNTPPLQLHPPTFTITN